MVNARIRSNVRNVGWLKKFWKVFIILAMLYRVSATAWQSQLAVQTVRQKTFVPHEELFILISIPCRL